MFGVKSNSNVDGFSVATLLPGIYVDAELTEVKKEKSKKADGSEGKTILTFLFNTPKGAYQHTEWETDDAKKGENLSTRVAHILTKFIPRTTVDAIQATTFGEYCDKVIANLAQSYKGVKLEIKVVGNVYNGEARTQFPLYPPFIARPGYPEYKPLSFDQNQLKANLEYNNFQAATPDAETSAGTPVTGNTNTAGAKIDTDF